MNRAAIKIAALTAALIAVIWITRSAVLSSYQNSCTFGPVTNSQYQELQRRIQGSLRGQKSGDSKQLQLTLDQAFDEFVNKEPDIYLKIASAHAVLRSLGAQFRNWNDNLGRNTRQYPFRDDKAEASVVVLNYYLGPVGLKDFFNRVVLGEWIVVHIGGPGLSKPGVNFPLRQGELSPKVKLLSVYLDGLSRPVAEANCPPVPAQSDASDYNRAQ